jgi:hypothetical protein
MDNETEREDYVKLLLKVDDRNLYSSMVASEVQFTWK